MFNLEERNAKRRAAYAVDGGKRRDYNQRWKKENIDRTREVNRLSIAKMREVDPERFKLIDKRYRSNNSTKVALTQRAWRAKNPDYYKNWVRIAYHKDPRRFLVNNCKIRAAKKGVPFNITAEDLIIPEFCPVLGLKLETGPRGFHPNSPSIDRLIPAKGYVKGNVRVISWRANELKRDGTLDEFRKIVAYLEKQ